MYSVCATYTFILSLGILRSLLSTDLSQYKSGPVDTFVEMKSRIVT